MKLKPRGARKPGECVVEGCHEEWRSYGFCRPHLKELNGELEKGSKAVRAVVRDLKKMGAS